MIPRSIGVGECLLILTVTSTFLKVAMSLSVFYWNVVNDK